MSRILIVEDNGAVREVLEETFCREGILAVTAKDGEEAHERLRAEGPFDAVILDLILPGDKDGYSVCREIRAGMGGEANRDLPVIMLTVCGDETSVVLGLEVGADDYVTKPFRPRELVRRVQAHLRRGRLDSNAAPQE